MDGEQQAPKEDKAQDQPKEDEAQDLPREGSGEKPGGEPDMRQFLLPSDVKTLSHFFISLLGNTAWQHLGLMAHPQTGEVKKDMKQAKQAIDIISFLYDTIKEDVEKEQGREIRDLLTNLSMNFVEKSRPESEG